FGLDKFDKSLNAQADNGRGTGENLPQTARADVKAGTPNPQVADASEQGEPGIWPIPEEKLRRKLAVPSQGRLYYVRYALKMGWTIDQVHQLTNYDPWFLAQMKELVDFEGTPEEAAVHWSFRKSRPSDFARIMQTAKQCGYSDVQLAHI